MKIYLTKHTKERMALRKITKDMIKSSIFAPDEVGYGYFGRSIAFKKFRNGVVKIIYLKEKDKHIIISAIWHKKNKKL